MDKHDRPYKCGAIGCEKLPGFTYSGGLLRHEREVHGKHGGPKNPLHCPHESCKRATGKGFSRLENLNEHLRRVHTHNVDGTAATNHGGIGGMGMGMNGGLSSSNGCNGMGGNMHDIESDEATSDDTLGGHGHSHSHSHSHSHAQSHHHHQQHHSYSQSHQFLKSRKRRHTEIDNGGSETTTMDLREEVKRLRQENEELREQVHKNTQQTNMLVQRLQALTEAMALPTLPTVSGPVPQQQVQTQNQRNNVNNVVPPTTAAAVAGASASSY